MKNLIIPAFLLASAFSGQAAIVITEVMSSSLHGNGTNNADWFEITNTGSEDIDLTDWTWNDSDTSDANTSLSALGIIASGQSVIITGEGAATGSAWGSDWGLTGVTFINQASLFHNFSASGDSIYIYNPGGTLVVSLTFGEATPGATFVWDTSGNYLGTSVAGVDGAYTAISNGQTSGLGAGLDIGSPGTAIPEPSAALFGTIPGLLLLLRRRK